MFKYSITSVMALLLLGLIYSTQDYEFEKSCSCLFSVNDKMLNSQRVWCIVMCHPPGLYKTIHSLVKLINTLKGTQSINNGTMQICERLCSGSTERCKKNRDSLVLISCSFKTNDGTRICLFAFVDSFLVQTIMNENACYQKQAISHVEISL